MSWAGPFQIEIGKTRYSNPPKYSQSTASNTDEDTIPLVCFAFTVEFRLPASAAFAVPVRRDYRVYFVEEPLNGESMTAWLDVRTEEGGVRVVVPKLPEGRTVEQTNDTLRTLLDEFFAAEGVFDPVLWYYTPMMLDFTRSSEGPGDRLRLHGRACRLQVRPAGTDRASSGAAEQRRPGLHRRLQRCGKPSATRHPNVHPFPEQRRRRPLRQARALRDEPDDQERIPAPAGLLRRDRRADGHRPARRAGGEARRTWQLVMVGPVVKIDPATLPSSRTSTTSAARPTTSCRSIWPAGTWR